jgi:hypothetical protein
MPVSRASLIALLALCALNACIGPGLEPPKGTSNTSAPRGPGSRDESRDAGTTGSGNFGNAGNTNAGTDGTTNPQTPDQPDPTVTPPVDMGANPGAVADEDAGTDPADSP